MSQTYYYDGDRLIGQVCSDGTAIMFNYGTDGEMFGFSRMVDGYQYDYYYVKNAQGDVLKVMNQNMDVVARYYYDAWGAIRQVQDGDGNIISDTTSQNCIANINPIRYRGYYYDIETGLYYLQTRYYDPEIGRFISRDSYEYIGANDDLGSHNLFAYCSNNPVACADYNGNDAIWLHYGKERGGGYGHAALLVQNEEGVWYYFSWGAKRTSNKWLLFWGTESSCYWKSCDTNVFLNTGSLLANSGDENATVGLIEHDYISGDFSASWDYLNDIKENQDNYKYRLISFNCVQVCTRALSYGEFDKNSAQRKRAMLNISGIYNPAKAFRAWNWFDDNIDDYMSASWFERLFMNNPERYMR